MAQAAQKQEEMINSIIDERDSFDGKTENKKVLDKQFKDATNKMALV